MAIPTDKILAFLIKSLERRNGICCVNLDLKEPATDVEIKAWEQKNGCNLPDDLRNFYYSSNGLNLTWKIKMNETEIPVGKLFINDVSRLLHVANNEITQSSQIKIYHLESLNLHADGDPRAPYFDQRSRVFELDPCDGNGKVCLVYNNTKPGVPGSSAQFWFLDRSLQWYFLAETFLEYYRMLILHIGLPQWQFAYTSVGLSPQAKQWFYMYLPFQMEQLEHFEENTTPSNDENACIQFDPTRVFRAKNDKKKSSAMQNTKKKVTPGIVSKSSSQNSRHSTSQNQCKPSK